MDFKTMMDNYTYNVTAENFEPIREERIGFGRDGKTERTGAFIDENGNAVFKVYAPEARTVTVSFSSYVRGARGYTIELEKNEDGFFEGMLPYDEKEFGPRDFNLVIDGARVTTAYAPTYFRGNKPSNYIELPDSNFDLHLIKNVPHGTVAYRIYWSGVMNQWKRCLVYLPAEYEHEPNKRYPVLYLNNGGSENETTWTYAGKLPMIMDNLIAARECVPMIVVMNNTMARLPEEAVRRKEELYGWREMVLRDNIPFIESEYRVLADKWHRAMAGNSMGSMATGFMCFAHPELFGSMGLIAGSIRTHDFHPEFDENEQIQWLKEDAAKVGEQYKVIFRSRGDGELAQAKTSHYTIGDDEWLHRYGIDALPCYHVKFYEGGFYHDWRTFQVGLADFLRLLFKD